MKLKEFLLLTVVYLFTATGIYAQWAQLNPSTTSWLKDINCPTNDICYVVGTNGTVLKTTDGGQSWTQLTNGLDLGAYYTSIYCIDALQCFVGGSSGSEGVIYYTTNGGSFWQATIVPIGFGGITDFFMVNDTVGYAGRGGGDDYLKTTDGINWSWNAAFLSNGGFHSFYFINESIGFLGSGIGDILKTTNGGTNWSYSFQGACGAINGLFFLTDSIGFAVSDGGCIYKTYDQGNNWDTLTTGIVSSFNDIFCIDKDTCYVVGNQGHIIKTINGGTTWQWDTTGANTNKKLNAVFFPTPSVGYIAGDVATILKRGMQTGIPYYNNNSNAFRIYPNLIGDDRIINIQSNYNFHYPIDFILYDIVGKEIFRTTIKEQRAQVHLGTVQRGLYLFIIKNKNQIFLQGKLLIQ